MLKLLNTKTQKYSAAMMTGAMLGLSNAVNAQVFDEYAETLSENTNSIPDIVAFISYLGGTALAALGIVGLKQHVENPSQTPMKNGLAKLGFGGMLIALPTITGVLLDTTVAGGQANYTGFTNSPTVN